ncbi:NAD(P) transhydrogenase subunit alpha [Luteibacter rhizovicinus]|uniref:proton-translocating NAD(P)(+) transhydrogenase n=1 Tax=Luteibacter rhizovicinus TaxID=242606 RepID=A0A4R3YJT9_9GAMM|nr:NAD(P) transhydrogenase subunit alpha [Luteibacter rhizovicinus]TCV91274.1 NAD(P) transhydrogenase subunit alpha [Luteibacter rhizovicinus]
MPMTVGALRETAKGERRVALTPETARKLVARGLAVIFEHDAGREAGFPDATYVAAGATPADAADVAARADLLLCVQLPPADRLTALRAGTAIVGQLRPNAAHDRLEALGERGVTAFSLELLPRTTRAQAMDVLSSQAAVAGYRAMLIAAEAAPMFFPMLTTAAGTIRPAKVLVIGAGVAGLQAIATARRLGAQIEGYDVRPETREQIESLGARFLDLGVSASGSGGYARELSAEEQAAQQAALGERLRVFDVVVTTAAVPGRPAPKILTAAMLEGMKPGALIVDLAAESGGNCVATVPGQRVNVGGVTVLGPLDLAAGAPLHASEMYARNLLNFAGLLVRDGGLSPDFADDLVAATCVNRVGEKQPQLI